MNRNLQQLLIITAVHKNMDQITSLKFFINNFYVTGMVPVSYQRDKYRTKRKTANSSA
jgi:hypothetical protein